MKGQLLLILSRNLNVSENCAFLILTANFRRFLFLENENPDVFIGTEAWLNSRIPTSEFFAPNYSVLRKDRRDGYGGVLVAVKDLSCQELGDLSTDSELTWVKISLVNKKHVYIGAFYNPNSSLEALNGIDASLSKQQKKSGTLIFLVSDFNLGGDICWRNYTIAADNQNSTV